MAVAVRRRAIPLVLPLAVVVALVAGACSLTSSVTGPREWTQTLTSADGTDQEVVVRDESGRLTNVEIDPVGVPMAMEISNPAGEANVVLVPWTGGACDKRTEIMFKAAGAGARRDDQDHDRGRHVHHDRDRAPAAADVQRAAAGRAGHARARDSRRADGTPR